MKKFFGVIFTDFASKRLFYAVLRQSYSFGFLPKHFLGLLRKIHKFWDPATNGSQKNTEEAYLSHETTVSFYFRSKKVHLISTIY